MIPSATMRRSSSGKDAAQSCAETAVRIRPRRSGSVRGLVVRPVAPAVLEPMMSGRHYLRSMPPAAIANYGVYDHDRLVGGVVITAGARHGHRILAGADQSTVATVARVWIGDEVGKNAESRVLSVVARLVARNHGVKMLLSYADPAAGHRGTIYMAAGWLYLGMSDTGRYLALGDGEPRHPRSVASMYGTNRPSQLRKMGIPARSVLVGGKHRYCLILDHSWAWRLAAQPKPYPARAA